MNNLWTRNRACPQRDRVQQGLCSACSFSPEWEARSGRMAYQCCSCTVAMANGPDTGCDGGRSEDTVWVSGHSEGASFTSFLCSLAIPGILKVLLPRPQPPRFWLIHQGGAWALISFKSPQVMLVCSPGWELQVWPLEEVAQCPPES